MKQPRVLTLILAGGAGGRLGVLTKKRAKPSLPFGGTLRLIDFSLSNCLHSGLTDVWVIEQYQLHSLNDHLANGRPWDLDRTYGGLQVLPPYVENGDEDGDGESETSGQKQQGGFAEGNADAIYRQRRLIRDFRPDLIVVLSADHVYKLDYRDVIDQHQQTGAEVTMVTTTLPPGEKASRFGVVQVDPDGRVRDFAYKPEEPRGETITAEVFVYTAERLLATLDAIVAEGGELKDYGNELIPRLVKAGKAWSFPLEGYWRDVGTVESYWRAHMDLLRSEDGLALDDPAWPILTYATQRLPARVQATAEVTDSLLSPGGTIGGIVANSILGPDVIVEAGATVTDSVILHGVRIRSGARVQRAIVDENVEIGAGARVGDGDESDFTVIGSRAKIAPSQTVGAGEQLPPG